jgi:hypothetical protein
MVVEPLERRALLSASVASPPAGSLYHGVYPGGVTGEEDDITPAGVDSYVQTVGKDVAWVYFSDNWRSDRQFPLATAEWIRDRGSVPFIRMRLTSSRYPDVSSASHEKVFTLKHILRGDFDADLRAWGDAARDFGSPLILEFGTEMNGDWFSWNGKYAGGGRLRGFGDPHKADGPEKFVAAYRHIVELIRGEGANNITWVWHVNNDDQPTASWNRFENYYPGDDVVDWVGVSDYGAQDPRDKNVASFRDQMDPAYARLEALAPTKPVVICEFGDAARNASAPQAQWAASALADLTAHRWSNVIGFSWWNEQWQNDYKPAHDTDMRVQDSPDLAQTFRDVFSTTPIQEHAVFAGA